MRIWMLEKTVVTVRFLPLLGLFLQLLVGELAVGIPLVMGVMEVRGTLAQVVSQ